MLMGNGTEHKIRNLKHWTTDQVGVSSILAEAVVGDE